MHFDPIPATVLATFWTSSSQNKVAPPFLNLRAAGALQRKLDAWVRASARYAEAIEKQKWVPEVALGAPAVGNGNAAQNLLDLFVTKTAKDLALDMSVKN